MSRRAIVVGAGQGGLSAALSLASRGWSVTVFEQRERAGGKAARQREGRFLVDPGPSIVILPEVYRRALAEAAANPGVLEFRRLDPVTRVCFEGEAPFDLPASIEECLRLVAGQSPSDAAGLRRILGSADALAPWVERCLFGSRLGTQAGFRARPLAPWGSYRQAVDRLLSLPWLRALFYGFPSYSGADYRAPGPGPFFIPYYMWRDGVWEVKGGVGAIPEAFEAAARAQGVEFVFGCRARRVLMEAGRAVAVETDRGEAACDALVVNADRPGAAGLLGRAAPKGRAGPSYYTLWLGVEARPEGWPAHTVFVPRAFEGSFDELYRDGQPPQDPIVYWNWPGQAAPPGGPSGLFAAVTVPSAQHVDWGAEAPRLRARALESLARAGIPAGPSELELEQHPETFASRDGNWHGSLYGPAGRRLPLPQRDPELRNVFYCGGSVRPGAGLPMVTLSGSRAGAMADRLA